MRGPFCSWLFSIAPLVVLAGCSGDPQSGPLPVYTGSAAHGGTTGPAPSVDNEQVTAPAPNRSAVSGFTPATPDYKPIPVPTFRDYAAYSFTDRGGVQWVSQILLNMDGAAYNQRNCPISDTNGTEWNECEDWQVGIPTATLGINVHFISSIGAFVFVDSSNVQTLVETAFDIKGDERLGRSCPMDDKSPALDKCSEWSKLASPSSDLGIAGVTAFRGDDGYAFLDPTNAPVFAQRVLSVDGSQAWHRSCAAPSMLFDPAAGCDWSSVTSIGDLDLYEATALSGWGAHVFMNAGQQVFTESIISEDGTKSARRECLFAGRAIDERTCSNWSYRSLDSVLLVNQTIL